MNLITIWLKEIKIWMMKFTFKKVKGSLNLIFVYMFSLILSLTIASKGLKNFIKKNQIIKVRYEFLTQCKNYKQQPIQPTNRNRIRVIPLDRGDVYSNIAVGNLAIDNIDPNYYKGNVHILINKNEDIIYYYYKDELFTKEKFNDFLREMYTI